MSVAVYNPDGFALQIFRDRYAIHAEETFGQACERVARSIADAEMGTKRDEYFARFLDILQTNRFSPGGRIWRGAGRQRGQMLNCLQKDTLVHTKEYGLVPIYLLAGTTAEVLSQDGVFRDATWFSAGKQQLYKIILKNGDTLFATAEHEWPVIKSGHGLVKKKTTELMGKDHRRGPYCLLVQSRKSFEIKNEVRYRQGVRHGLVFGDGSLYCDGRLSHMPQFGDSKHLVADHFDNKTHWPSIDADVATKLPASFKQLPDIDEGEDYLRGFIAGWIAADGCVDSRGMVMGHNKDLETIQYIRRICAEVGIATSSIRLDRDVNPFNGEPSALYKLTFAKQSFFNDDKQDNSLLLKNKHRDNFAITADRNRNKHSVKVIGVEPTDRWEEVFCCEEQETHTFVIEEGCYLTGNCFVWTDDLDSREGWGDALRAVTIISGTGGGIGLNFSRVRPRGSAIRGTGGEATGAVSLMRCINAVCNELREGGGRRSALMFCLKYDHPDLMEFLEAKLDKGELSNANISVCIDDAFLKLLDEKGEVIFRWQGEERGRIAAKDIWDKIVHNAWESGDPGVLNIGLANAMNTISYRHDLVSTNPSMPAGTLVYTSNGVKKIEQLEDQSFKTRTPDGKLVHAVCRLSSNNANMLEIDFGGNRTLRSTADHKWPVVDSHGRICRIAAGDLKKNDKILSHPNRSLGLCGNPDFTEEDGFFVGYLLGDGWISLRNNTVQNNRYALGMVFGPNEKYLAERILVYVNNRKKRPSTITQKDNCWYIQTTDQEFIENIIDQFGFDIDKNGIPSSVWCSNDNYVRGFIDGLFSADGSVSEPNNVIVLTSSRKGILEDISKLLSFCGIHGTYRFSKAFVSFPNGKSGTYNRGDYRTQYIDEFTNVFTISHNTKKDKLSKMHSSLRSQPIDGQSYLLVRNVRECGKEKVWDISVDHEQHIFPTAYSYTGNCGEIWMPPYDCCCLGAVNLHTHVIDGDVDWDLLEETVAMSVRFLDDVLDQNNYPMSIIQETCQKYRRIGLGVMGLHDMLLELGLKYSSKAAREVVDKVMDFVKKQAYHASITLAIEKGSFHAFDVDQHIKTGFVKKCLPRRHHRLIKEHGLRNCALLTIAPTGTISIVAGCSSGIEPLFQPVYQRRFNKHKDMHDDGERDRAVEVVVHPLLKQFLESRKSTKHFQGAHDIVPEAHLAMQAICQRHIDNSISKTVNLPTDHPVEQLSKEMRQYISELKGITVYRDGSKGESPLVPVPLSEAKQHLGRMEEEAAVNDCPSGVCEITKGGS